MKPTSKKDKAKRKQKIYLIATLILVLVLTIGTIMVWNRGPVLNIEIDNTILSKRGDLEEQSFAVDSIIIINGKNQVKWQPQGGIEGKAFDIKTEGNFTTFKIRGTKGNLTDIAVNIVAGEEKRHSGLSTSSTTIRIDLDFLNKMELWSVGEFK